MVWRVDAMLAGSIAWLDPATDVGLATDEPNARDFLTDLAIENCQDMLYNMIREPVPYKKPFKAIHSIL